MPHKKTVPTAPIEKEIARELDHIRFALDAPSPDDGKQLLVIVAEGDHHSTKSALLATLVYDELARRGKVANVGIEMSDNYRNSFDMFKITKGHMDGQPFIYSQAHFRGTPTSFVDTLHDIPDPASSQGIALRTQAIASGLGQIQQPPIMMLTGAAHAEELANNPELSRRFHIITFVTGGDPNWVFHVPTLARLSITRDASHLSARDVIRLTMHDSAAYLDYLHGKRAPAPQVPVVTASAAPATSFVPPATAADTLRQISENWNRIVSEPNPLLNWLSDKADAVRAQLQEARTRPPSNRR